MFRGCAKNVQKLHHGWACMQEKADADAAAAEGTSQMWVAQKYIEQPLIINRRYINVSRLAFIAVSVM